MKTLTIDYTRTAGNFFDNINNYNYIAEEYYFDDEDIVEKVDDVDNLFSKLKYDYINNDTLKKFINPKYEKIYRERNSKLFKMTSTQYSIYKDFCKEHHKCVKNFGAIGGGIEVIYKLNYTYDFELPNIELSYVKCLGCNKKKNFDTSKSTTYFDYNEYMNYYIPKFDKVEFYRFMEIYNEYKKPLTIKLVNTGLGVIFEVIVDNYDYIITNIENW